MKNALIRFQGQVVTVNVSNNIIEMITEKDEKLVSKQTKTTFLLIITWAILEAPFVLMKTETHITLTNLLASLKTETHTLLASLTTAPL